MDERRLYTYRGHDIQCDRDVDGITVTIFPHDDNARAVKELRLTPETTFRQAWEVGKLGIDARIVAQEMGVIK